jgi:hypothetical protein
MLEESKLLDVKLTLSDFEFKKIYFENIQEFGIIGYPDINSRCH